MDIGDFLRDLEITPSFGPTAPGGTQAAPAAPSAPAAPAEGEPVLDDNPGNVRGTQPGQEVVPEALSEFDEEAVPMGLSREAIGLAPGQFPGAVTSPAEGGGRGRAAASVQVEQDVLPPLTPEEQEAAALIQEQDRNDLLDDGLRELTTSQATTRELEEFADAAHEDTESTRDALHQARQTRDNLFSNVDEMVRSIAGQRVDPTRFFHTRGASAGFASALSVAAGSISSALNGSPNLAMSIIDRAVERDIRTQEFDIDNQSRSANTQIALLDRLRGFMGDDMTARETLRTLRLKEAESRINALASRSASDTQRARLQSLAATVSERAQVADGIARQQSIKITLKGNLTSARQGRELGRAAALARQIAQSVTPQETPQDFLQEESIPVSSAQEAPGGPGIGRDVVRGRRERPEATTAPSASLDPGVGDSAVDPESPEGPVLNRFNETRDEANVLSVSLQGDGNDRFFDLTPDSPARYRPGESRERPRKARVEATRRIGGAINALRILQSAAATIRGQGLTVAQLNAFGEDPVARGRLVAEIQGAVQAAVELARDQSKAGVLSETEFQRFSRVVGASSFADDVLNEVGVANVRVTVAARMQRAAAALVSKSITAALLSVGGVVPRSGRSDAQTARIAGDL